MNTKNLCVGKPWKVLLLFALPMILSVTLQQIYNIGDSVIAGRFIGTDALSAISTSYPITMLFLGLASGAGVGTNVIVSRFFGMKKYAEAKKAIYTSLIAFILFSIILALLGVLLTKQMLIMLNTDELILEQAKTYLMIYCFGIVFLFLYNITTFIFQALGNSKTPLFFLAFSTALNIFLDLLFVVVFKMGIFGIAIATLIAQGIASLAAFFWLLRVINKNFKEKTELFSFNTLKNILLIAIPSMIQGSIVAIGGLFVQSEINSYGYLVCAGYGAAYKMCYIIVNIFFSLSNALSSYTSQNMGAREIKRIKDGHKACIIMSLIFGIIATAIYLLFANNLLHLFMKAEDGIEVLEIGEKFIYITTPFYLVVALKICYDGVLKGSGDMISFMFGTFVDLVLRIIFTFIFSRTFGYEGIWWSWPVGWVVATILVFILFYCGRWKKINKIEKA